jgi:alkylation response protein AidB-like acyl-CoA dehydrogenase
MITNGVSWWASLLPDEGQEEIFAKSGIRLCAAGNPTCQGRRVEGGVRISGKFPFASGGWHASWGGLSAGIEDDSRNIELVNAFAPMTELPIEDTWHVAGMCGTGSNTLVADDVFVPDRRVLKLANLLSGEHQGARHNGESSDRYTWSAANTLIGVGPIIGIAQAMLEQVIEGTSKRGITFTTYTRQADSAVVQHQIAEAALGIDSAHFGADECSGTSG